MKKPSSPEIQRIYDLIAYDIVFYQQQFNEAKKELASANTRFIKMEVHLENLKKHTQELLNHKENEITI